MILLLGANGFVGRAFQAALAERGEDFVGLSRQQLDYSHYSRLVEYLRSQRPRFVINAAGFTGKPNVDACERLRAEAVQGNVLLPQTISHACQATETPWGHVSSGCIYSGAAVLEGGVRRIEPRMSSSELKHLVATNPAAIVGFSETDEPNFSFRHPPCSFYSGTKALGEEVLAADPQCYRWRLRIPFNEIDGPRNFLSKLQRYDKVYDSVNSISHLSDFVNASLDLWRSAAPFGTYNMTNPGFVTSRQVVEMICQILRPPRQFEFWQDDDEFYRLGARAPRSNCVLDASKLLGFGVRIRPIEEALIDALRSWRVPARRAS